MLPSACGIELGHARNRGFVRNRTGNVEERPFHGPRYEGNDDGLQPMVVVVRGREEWLAETWGLTLLWDNAGDAKLQQSCGSSSFRGL